MPWIPRRNKAATIDASGLYPWLRSRIALKTREAATTGTTWATRKLLTKSLVTFSTPWVYWAPVAPAIVSWDAPGTPSLLSQRLTPGRLISKHPQNSHLRKPPLASKFIPPSERSRIPAMTNAPSAAGMAKSIRRPRIALKTSGVCMCASPHRLTLRDEVLDQPQDAGYADQTPSGHRGRQPTASAPPLQHGCDNGDAGAYRTDHDADPNSRHLGKPLQAVTLSDPGLPGRWPVPLRGFGQRW